MITVTVYKTQGAQTVRASISAPTIEEAVRIAGEGARLELPIDGELFFAPQQAPPVAKGGTDDASTTLDGMEAACGGASRPLGGPLGGARREVLPAGTSGAGRRLAGYGQHGRRRRAHHREDVHPQGLRQGDEVRQEVDGHREGQAGRRRAASEKEGRQEQEGQRIGTAGPRKRGRS